MGSHAHGCTSVGGQGDISPYFLKCRGRALYFVPSTFSLLIYADGHTHWVTAVFVCVTAFLLIWYSYVTFKIHVLCLHKVYNMCPSAAVECAFIHRAGRNSFGRHL